MEGLLLMTFINMSATIAIFFVIVWWYYTSIKNQEQREYQNGIAEEKRIKEMFDLEEERRKKAWEEFIPAPTVKPFHDITLPNIDFNNPQPKRDENGKFNPDEINGALDGFFDEKNTTDGGNFK